MEQIGKKQNQPKNFIGMNGQVKHILIQQTGLGFANRDTQAKKQQENNIITFKIIKNDQTKESMKFLLDLKNIFARQLPKMPKQYIVKLVFDRNHESMVILKDNIKVIGGICFRPFNEQRFVEIAFLAITSTQQIRGYGTRLMNKLKEQMQKRKIQFMMTYADNLALGYFRKQGFSKQCRTQPDRWKGYIKDYQGGTLMECLIHPTIDYSRVSEIIKKQKQFVIKSIKDLSINQIKHNGKELEKIIEKEKQFKRTNNDGQIDTFRINPEKIPGVVEGGWTWQDHQQLRKTKQLSFQLQCSSILDLMKKFSASWPFRDPVSLQDVPDYHAIVRRPIDLKTIEKKLINNEYNTRAQFCEDILLIFSNSRLYNQPQTVYHKCANDCQEYIKPHLQKLQDETQDQNLQGMMSGNDKVPKKHHPIKKRIQKRRT